jgi:membrane dipeptidase
MKRIGGSYQAIWRSGAALAIVAAFQLAGCSSAAVEPTDVAALHEGLLTLDTHLDTPITLLRPNFDFSARHDPIRDVSRVDLPRMESGGLDGGFFAVFVPQGARDAAGLRIGKANADAAFARIETLLARFPNELKKATTATDTMRIVSSGKRAVLIGIENGHALGGQLDNVAEFRQRGARYISLVHTRNNDLGDSSTDTAGSEHGGLSEFGRSVVQEMNRCGIMVDVSHASDATARAAIELSAAPVIASHSGARAVYGHPRNLPDDLLQAIAATKGVIQVHAMGTYLRKLEDSPERIAALTQLRAQFPAPGAMSDEERVRYWAAMGELNVRHPQPLAEISDVAAHIDYIARLVGVDHVGIGADFDGGGGVRGLLDVADYPNLTRELMKLGYGKHELAKIWSGNLLRVLAANEEVAVRLSATRPCAPL